MMSPLALVVCAGLQTGRRSKGADWRQACDHPVVSRKAIERDSPLREKRMFLARDDHIVCLRQTMLDQALRNRVSEKSNHKINVAIP
jgi:hypothetical protein